MRPFLPIRFALGQSVEHKYISQETESKICYNILKKKYNAWDLLPLGK